MVDSELAKKSVGELWNMIEERDETIARLREALGWISTLSGETCVHAGHTLDEIYAVAQTALAGPEEKESKENPIRANFPPFDHRNLGKRGEE